MILMELRRVAQQIESSQATIGLPADFTAVAGNIDALKAATTKSTP